MINTIVDIKDIHYTYTDVLMNDYSHAGSGFWGNTRNHH